MLGRPSFARAALSVASVASLAGLVVLTGAASGACSGHDAELGSDGDGSSPTTTTTKTSGGADSGGGSTAPAGTVPLPTGLKVDAGSTAVTPGTYSSLKITVGTEARTYGLFVPGTYKKGTALPLVFVFHGDGGSGAEIRKDFPIEAAANNGALFVYPDGTNDNSGHSFDQLDDPPNNHDVDFFDAMLSTLTAAYSVETTHVYVTGMSGGAYFVNQLARWRESVIWGNAPQSGGGPFGNGDSDFNSSGNLSVPGPVPSLIIHGSADEDVALSEGQKSLAYWTGANGCSTSGKPTSYGTSPCVLEPSCAASSPVVWCEIPGMGHTIWTDAPAAIWSFFTSLGGKR